MSDIFAPIPISRIACWPEQIAAPLLRANRPDAGGDANLRFLSETELAAAKVPAAHQSYLSHLVASYQQGSYATLPAGRLRFRATSYEGHSNVELKTRDVVITAAPRLASTNLDSTYYFLTLLDDDAKPTHTVRVEGPENKKTTWSYEGTVQLEEGKSLYVRITVPKQRLDDGDIDVFVKTTGPGTHEIWGGRSLRGARAIPEY